MRIRPGRARHQPKGGEIMRKLLALAVVALALPALALAGGQAMSPVVSAKLKGANETPVKGDPDGSGFVVVTFNANKGTACWKFKGVKGDRHAQCSAHPQGPKGHVGTRS